MKGPYIIKNSKGQIVDIGYSVFNTNKEGKEYTLKVAESIKNFLQKYERL